MKKLFTALALLFTLTLTACSDGVDTDLGFDPQTPAETTASATTSAAASTTASTSVAALSSQPEESTEPEPFIPGAKYYKLPDGTIYTAPDDDGMFLLGYAFVRENADLPDDEIKWQKLGSTDEWNGLWVKYAQSGGWTAYSSYSDAVSANTRGDMSHHQTINFLGEKTFTGKAAIIYAANGETPAYYAFYLDEESGSEMPLFGTRYYHSDENSGYYPVFFTLYHEDYMDKCEEVANLLSEGKEVTVTITTDDFMWEYSDYGLVIDGRTRGYFNTILSFEISVD